MPLESMTHSDVKHWPPHPAHGLSYLQSPGIACHQGLWDTWPLASGPGRQALLLRRPPGSWPAGTSLRVRGVQRQTPHHNCKQSRRKLKPLQGSTHRKTQASGLPDILHQPPDERQNCTSPRPAVCPSPSAAHTSHLFTKRNTGLHQRDIPWGLLTLDKLSEGAS